MEKRNIGYIDALKGLAIIGVTMVHTGGSSLPGIFGRIGSSGARGVQLFFLISGMLAFSSLANFFPKRDDISFFNIITWYRKKIIRLIPMYYLAIICSMLTRSWSTYWLGNEGHVTIKNLLAHIFFVHGLFPHYTDSILGVDWYLGVLVFFLFISPFIYRIVDNLEKSIVLFITVYVMAPLLNGILASIIPIENDLIIYDAYIGTFNPLAQSLVYTIGIVLFFCIEKINKADIKNRQMLSYSTLFLVLILIYGQINGQSKVYRLSGSDMFGLYFAIIIISQTVHSSFLINNPLFRMFGKFSYGMYLFQFIWINFYERYIGVDNWLIKFIVSNIALLTISYCLTRFYDKPIQKLLKDRLFKTKEQ